MPKLRRPLLARARYVAVLARRFKTTFAAAAAIFAIAPWFYVWLYRAPDGSGVGIGRAIHHTYFLLFGQPSLDYVDNPVLEGLNMLLPPIGLAVVVDGIVRLAVIAFAREQNDAEWIAVVASTFQDHVVVCGAGRVGWRTVEQLHALGREVVVIEKKDDTPFVRALRELGIPVLIDDIRARGSLTRANLEHASAIVAVTDDDLANLNVALDARRMNPKIRVVIRLFDDDLAATVRATLGADAFSTSAIAAPHLALSALDPRILHSFRVGPHLLVVVQLDVGRWLGAETVKNLRDVHGALTLAIGTAAGEELHPSGPTQFPAGGRATVQLEWTDWLRLMPLVDGAARD